MSQTSAKVVPNMDDTKATEDEGDSSLPDTDLNWDAIPIGTKKKKKDAPQGTAVDVSTMKMAAYVKKRQDMKEKIVKEVLDAALPDVSGCIAYNVIQ